MINGVTGRVPSTPLMVHDPTFSCWSATDELTVGWTKHWTNAARGMTGLLRVDGKTWQFLGEYLPKEYSMKQDSREIFPLQTIYRFSTGQIGLTLTFLSPVLPHDMELIGRPASYVTFEIQSRDGKEHEIQLYFDLTVEWGANSYTDEMIWRRYRLDGISVMQNGTLKQNVLARCGDDLRQDWGYMTVAVPDQGMCATHMGALCHPPRDLFREKGALPPSDDLRMPRQVHMGYPPLSTVFDCGRVGAAVVERHIILAYEDIYCLEYMQRKLRPWWQRGGKSLDVMLGEAASQYAALRMQCADYDARLMADMEKAGGRAYAELCALAFRQCVGAHKLGADFDGSACYFSKECFSNGCIDTVDVTYPSSPFFLLFGPELLKAQLRPLLDYAKSPRWKFPFAPHDLGVFPLANGQVYGGGEDTEENQMPVEESGNLIIMIAALSILCNDHELARDYDGLCATWAGYLLEKGLDPENQLCTDDFAGHLAHNANLSLKAIIALAAYGKQREMLGDAAAGERYRSQAKKLASQWVGMADDGDHFRLAFDKPGTWSQKYNLVWDRLLGLDLFPTRVAATEIAWYLKQQRKYGLPLDNRKDYTKIDWTVWTATLAEKAEDFETLMAPLRTWLAETPNRVPMTDWFWTDSGKQAGFQARSVVGGMFIKLLKERNGKCWR